MDRSDAPLADPEEKACLARAHCCPASPRGHTVAGGVRIRTAVRGRDRLCCSCRGTNVRLSTCGRYWYCQSSPRRCLVATGSSQSGWGPARAAYVKRTRPRSRWLRSAPWYDRYSRCAASSSGTEVATGWRCPGADGRLPRLVRRRRQEWTSADGPPKGEPAARRAHRRAWTYPSACRPSSAGGRDACVFDVLSPMATAVTPRGTSRRPRSPRALRAAARRAAPARAGAAGRASADHSARLFSNARRGQSFDRGHILHRRARRCQTARRGPPSGRR